MILLSIIIPHYRNVDGLKRLLKSIFEGSAYSCHKLGKVVLSRFEVIIVDDYSGDETLEGLSNLATIYPVKLLHNKGKKSAGACRNIGLKESSGEWVLFSDSDDFFVAGFFESIIECANNGADIVFFPPTSVYDEDINKKSNRHVYLESLVTAFKKEPSSMQENYLRTTWNSPCSKILKNSFLQKHQIYFSETLAANDLMFSLKAGSFAEKIMVSSRVIYCITSRKGSLEGSLNLKIAKSRILEGIEYRRFCEKNNISIVADNYLGYTLWSIRLGFVNFLTLIKFTKKRGGFESAKYCVWFLKTLFFRMRNDFAGKMVRLFVRDEGISIAS